VIGGRKGRVRLERERQAAERLREQLAAAEVELVERDGTVYQLRRLPPASPPPQAERGLIRRRSSRGPSRRLA
jgi:hypothetical protein